MKQTIEEFELGNDMPHECLMDEHGLTFNDLTPMLQRQLRAFDDFYEKALTDEFISNEEKKELINRSWTIATLIKQELNK